MSQDPPKTIPCPICGNRAEKRYKPFCSDRCRMRDLAHWIGADEPYVIPGPSLVPEGIELGEEERALLAEAMAESRLAGDNVIRADFRTGKILDGDDS
ncbi:MAG: DNA gyrase inhibitor YacG [Rhodospirillaceae bacterium]|jgi:uncharacterized protein|nr:DNA gyrase inhibitor YacG [Rhodospirillaceae bacterium]